MGEVFDVFTGKTVQKTSDTAPVDEYARQVEIAVVAEIANDQSPKPQRVADIETARRLAAIFSRYKD